MNNKLIVVLGMHRSGTSAITRGLQVFGANLGERIMPPAEGNNTKGFWEDIDLNALNIEMLKCINSDWFHLAAIESSSIEILHKQGFFIRAVELIQQKLNEITNFAFKDPRVAKLLPFWKTVFEHCNLEVSYVIAIRHPLSVVKSLENRDGIEAGPAYLLLLEHVLTSLIYSTNNKRVLVDYDRLLEAPDYELNRVATHLDLKIDFTELQNYKTAFLDEGLRHTVYSLNELSRDDACPPIVKEIYSTILKAASDSISMSELEPKVIQWANEFERLQSSLHLIDKISQQKTNANQVITQQNIQIDHLNHSVADQLTKTTLLNQAITERDGQIASLNQSIAERDGQIASVNQSVAERDAQIANLNQSVAERDYLINEIYKSTSWKATRLMRIAGYQVKRVQSATRLIAPAIKKGGGFKKTVYKAFLLYKRDGFTGIKSGFRFVARNGQVIPAAGSAEFDRNDYAEWIRRYDTLTNEMRANIKHSIGGFVTKPVISVLMPTYNPKAEWLVAAIESVRNQIYPNWELCIADDASTNPAAREVLEDYVKKDSRIKVVFREQNGHISAASNSALEVCTGDWVALLDHDDLLSEHALYWVADAINQHSDIQLIYSDEDKTDESGRRFDPYFKCDWNLDLFYSHNLITHLGVYSTKLIKQVNGFEIGLEGAQDYDLALRCIEHINPAQIHHIPRVLYHWRVHAESTALASDAKPYAMLAGEKALNQHLQRKGIEAKAELVGHGFRVHYNLPSHKPKVTLIIPTRNGLNLIRTCVESILKKTTYTNYEILIIDNGSDDPEVLSFFEEAKTDIRVKVVVDNGPFNYSALNNAAVKLAQGTFIGLLNNDLEVISPNWLSEMVSIALQPKVGAVGARLWYPNETLQHGGVIVGIGGWAGHSHKGYSKGHNGYVGRMSLISGFTAVTGACLIVNKMIFEQVGGLNETELKIACNDVDLCLRLVEAGYRNVWTPYAELYHHESATRGFEDTPEKQSRFREEVQYMHRRWGTMLVNDPAYSYNLTLDYEDFSLAWPPRINS